MFEDLDKDLPSYSQVTGFEDEVTKEKKDLEVAQKVLDRASYFHSLVEHPAYQYLDSSLKSTQSLLLDELACTEDIKKIRKLQAIIQVLKIFPTYIEHVFIDEAKAASIMENLKS